MKEQKKINRKAGCMFTGIIEEVGEIRALKKVRIPQSLQLKQVLF